MAAGRTPGQRAGLHRQDILDAALSLVDRDGLKALSMRRLGAELGVEAMTLYHHVPNKDALLDGLVEQVVARAAAPEFDGLDWRTAMRDYAHGLLSALLAHPGVIALVVSRPATTPQNLRLMEDALAFLCAAGFDVRQAMNIIYSLTGFVVGHAAALAGDSDDQHALGQVERLSRLDPEEFPLLNAAGRRSDTDELDSRFSFALDAMLSGFAEVLARQS